MFFKNYRVSLKRWHLQPNCLKTYMLPRPGKHKIHYKYILQPIILLPLAFQKAINLQKNELTGHTKLILTKVQVVWLAESFIFKYLQVWKSTLPTISHTYTQTHAYTQWVLPIITICQRVNLFKGWIKSNCQLITEHAKQSKNNSDFNWELRYFHSIATVAVQRVTLNAEQL